MEAYRAEVITPKTSLFAFNLKEVYRYRDLIRVFVRRDIVATYKQTVLGPLWFLISPLFTVLVYTFVFGQIAKLPTDGIPKPLFYLAGTTLWAYFQQCLLSSSGTFVANASIFGKVYFPRLVAPISTTISNMVKFLIQSVVLVLTIAYYVFFKDFDFNPNLFLLLFPVLLILLAGLALGLGLLVSALTTKYRDLQLFVSYGLILFMYACPIIYPASAVPAKYQLLTNLNPLTHIIEPFRLGLFGQGSFSVGWLAYTTGVTVFSLIIGIVMFNRTERTFMDTV